VSSTISPYCTTKTRWTFGAELRPDNPGPLRHAAFFAPALAALVVPGLPGYWFDRRACAILPGRTLRSGEALLSAPFDIFKEQVDGNAYWIESAEDLEAATARVRFLARTFPGQYLIVNNATGNKTFIPPKQ
jgi:hypothetical protein